MNEESDLISVVIPCYNSGETLAKAVNSVKNQTWKKFEIILVDDGSTDAYTLDVIKSVSNDVKLISQANLGLPAARNSGFKAASGKLVLPLDADDWLEARAIEEMVILLRSRKDLGFVFCNIQLENEASGILERNYNLFEQLSFNQLPYCILIRKSIWEDLKGYDETMKSGYEDWEFNIRIGASGYKGAKISKPLLHYSVSAGGMLKSKSLKLHGNLWRNIQERNSQLYNWLNLIKLFSQWSKYPSRYPLALSFLWIIIHRLMPKFMFAYLFRRLRS